MTQIWRLWCDIEGDPILKVPSIAIPSSIEFTDNTVTFRLARCPEVEVLLTGKRYEIKEGIPFSGTFECNLANTKKLKPLGKGYSIGANDLTTATFLAYYLIGKKDEEEAVTVEVVESVTANNQIVLSETGEIASYSPNLSGKTIKLIVNYPPAFVAHTNDPAESLTIHWITHNPDRRNEAVYHKATGCTFECIGKNIKANINDIESTVVPIAQQDV